MEQGRGAQPRRIRRKMRLCRDFDCSDSETMRSWPESGANSSWDLMAGATSNIHPIMLGLA